MALFLPPAVSVNRFQGGFKAVAYTELSDTETNDAKNVFYSPDGTITHRDGSLRLYNQPLFSTSATGTGRPITGHYFFDKLGDSSTIHIVAAGDSLYSYNSSTANQIRSTLTDNSQTYWTFIQIQDPRSAANDIALGTNGADPIQLWDGSGTAVALSSLTSATQVPICKYLLNHHESVYAINIVDATDVDAATRVYRTGFGSDGNADPHRFTQNFYVGGSSKDGQIQGAAVLNEQIIFYKEAAIWKFNPSLSDVNSLYVVDDSIGVLAPYSLVNTGDFHIFLSSRGVYAFDGSRPLHLSEFVDKELFENANLSALHRAKGVFDFNKNQYVLYYPSSGSSRNDTALIYDIRPTMKFWQPPVTGRQISFISSFQRNNQTLNVYGDYRGFLYEDDAGTNDGLTTGYNGTTTSATINTLTDSATTFETTAAGLNGVMVRIIAGLGEGQERVIESNTSNVLTLESNWTIVPDTTSQYTVGGINAYWRSKDYDFGGHDIIKIFRHTRVRTKEEGNINLTYHYIIDFKQLAQATSKLISLLSTGFAWGLGVWNQSRWGGGLEIKKKVSLRNTPEQRLQGTHFAVRFSNLRANERFTVYGYDIEMKAVGRR